MKKRIIFSAVLIGSLVTGSIALAGPYGFGNGGFGKGAGMMTDDQYQQVLDSRLERMDVMLDLDDNQQEQIKALLSKHWQERQPVREEMREGQAVRRATMQGGEFDEADLRSNMAKRADYQADRIVAQAKIKEEIYAILTPEQQDKAEKLMATSMNGGRGHHRGGFSF